MAHPLPGPSAAKPLTALGPGHASREGTSHQPPVPMPRPQCLAAPPSHRVVSAFGAVSTHKFMDQLSLLIWLQDETINDVRHIGNDLFINNFLLSEKKKLVTSNHQ